MAKQEKIEVPEGSKEEEVEEEKVYKNPVVFLRKSKAGKHLYAFNYEGALGGDVGSLIMDVSEVEKVIEGKSEWCKIGVLPVKEDGE